jgi:hypothetical protein
MGLLLTIGGFLVSCRSWDSGWFQSVWHSSPTMCSCCGRSDPEFSIGSSIAVHIGCLVDLARNDPS